MSESGSASAPASALSKGQVFARRFLSFAVLWSVVIWALFSENRFISEGVFVAVMLLLTVTGLAEFYGLVQKRGLVCFDRWGMFGGVLMVLGVFLQLTLHPGDPAAPGLVNDFESGFLILFVLGLCVRQFLSKSNTAGIVAISTTLFGLMYVAWLLNFIQKINFFPGVNGSLYVLFFIAVTKFSDCGAYVVGSLIGRHKMIPRISPGKTWEGFAGAIVVSTGLSVLIAWWAGDRLAGMNVTHAVILGIILSSAAVVGDLIESLFKRESGVKDSGKFFPGIGGILDLLDSLLFNAPLMYLYLRFVLTRE